MSTATAGSRLVLGLHRLDTLHVAPAQRDDRAAECLALWTQQVRDAVEPALVLDADGRVTAMSAGAGALLGVDPSTCVGTRLLELIVLVDFTETGVPLVDAEMSAPPLRALRSGRMSRGLMRLRLPLGTMPTFDVVGVPLAHGAGALGFLTEV